MPELLLENGVSVGRFKPPLPPPPLLHATANNNNNKSSQQAVDKMQHEGSYPVANNNNIVQFPGALQNFNHNNNNNLLNRKNFNIRLNDTNNDSMTATTTTTTLRQDQIANCSKMMTMDITKTEPNTGPNAQQQQPQQNGGNPVGSLAVANNNNNNSSNNNNNNNNNNGSQLCAGCGKHIQDRYLLRALDMLWHEDCLKCGCCDCRLGEVGSTLYTKGNLMLCKRDYLRLFGNTGYCAACSKVIPAFEMVMRARTNVYHLECFACQQCNHRFCVGDRFYLCENKILCEYDYEERMVFASMANHPMLKRHATTINQGSPTGAGSMLAVAGAGGAGGSVVGPNGPRTPGDHNNNNGPHTPNGGSPFGAAHLKNSLGASS